MYFTLKSVNVMDEKCFLIIAIILGVLILIVLAVMMIYSIIIKERIDDIYRKIDDDCL